MEISIRKKIEPQELLGKLEVEELNYENNFEVYLDDKRAPALIEEALLFFLNVKGEIYVQSVLKEMASLGVKNA